MGSGQADAVHVFDTRAQGKNGPVHFDVMTTDQETALRLVKEYLAGIGEADAVVTVQQCQLCHSEPLVFFSSDQQRQFRERGGFVIALLRSVRSP